MEQSITLVIFTFLSQLAIGAFATIFLFEAYQQKISKRATFISLISILSISVVAIIVSMFHLGHPFEAYKAILNFGNSWLSREIVFYPLFMLLVFYYGFVAKKDATKKATGWAAVVMGMITIYSTAMIYTIPAIPAWNNGMTMAAFFVTALLLGPVFVQLLILVIDRKFINLSLYIIVVAIVAILMNVMNLTILFGGFVEAVETASILISNPFFWVKLMALTVGVVIAGYSFLSKKGYSLPYVLVLLSCFVVAEFIGRILFYSSAIHL
ncbi:MAG: dimethyl sulfoxide reductase anchor subunit family protein [Anaerobacillus sp.]|uniref:dimethyl sulfoxide reductase anchor subunit family protein n=1 Tax=Anaerobacillus sp. TaxID=1872506 RepID=UPI00391B0AA4